LNTLPIYLLDTSALVKRYHLEVGRERVQDIFALPKGTILISDLTVVEFHSVFAKKIRTGELSEQGFRQVMEQFHSDIATGLIRVVPLTNEHKQTAIALLDKHGPSRALRTLDAFQLAIAVDLRAQRELTYFVTADDGFGKIAVLEGLAVINPEQA